MKCNSGLIAHTVRHALLAAIAGLSASEALAQPKTEFSGEASAGMEYDSNISVIELDQNTSRDDFAGAFDGELALDSALDDKTDFSLSYNFSQSLHFDFTNFDIQTHRGTVSLDRDLGPVKAGVSYFYAYSTLGRKGFLTLQRINPSLAGFVGKKVYLRAAYEYTDKAFKNRTDRDATVNAGGLTAFFFLDGTRTFISASYKLELQDATGPQFDYDGHNVRLRFSHDFMLGDQKVEFDAGWRYERRNYSKITPSIGVKRDDKRNRLEANLEFPLGERFYLRLEYEYDNFVSNLPSADFNQNLAAVRLGVHF
ncbi:MAG: hypothetical protein ACE5ED_10740 [Rhodothalassiaceae bacterium]